MATNWLSTAEMMAWRSFITTTGDLLRAIEHELEPFDLDMGDYQLLAMLSEAPEQQLRMSDLADALRLTRGGLTRRMEGVVKKKLVSRVQSAGDSQFVAIHGIYRNFRDSCVRNHFVHIIALSTIFYKRK